MKIISVIIGGLLAALVIWGAQQLYDYIMRHALDEDDLAEEDEEDGPIEFNEEDGTDEEE